jgi:hypothetical protein
MIDAAVAVTEPFSMGDRPSGRSACYHKRDCYLCPAGKELWQRQKIYRLPRPFVDENGMMRYRASKLDYRGVDPSQTFITVSGWQA